MKNLVAVYAPEQQEVIAQGRIDPDHEEIPAAQTVLQELDLQGKVVVGDALHAQRDLSTIHNIILSFFARLGFHNAAQARRFLDADLKMAFSILISAHPRL